MKRLILFLLILITSSMATETVTFATWNVRFKNDQDSIEGNGWNKRLPHIIDIIRFYDFDILNVQEPDPPEIEDMEKGLADYACVKMDTSYYHPIFYKKNKYQLLDKGQFWFSKTPEVKSKSWDSKHTRFCTWAKFKGEHQTFFVFNVHWDNKGDTARYESVVLSEKLIPKIAGKTPFILAGDFNSKPHHAAFKFMESKTLWKNAKTVAEFVYAQKFTFNHFYTPKASEMIIDHIFVSPSIKVYRYGTLNDMYEDDGSWRYPSDHIPVVTKLILEN